MTGFEFRAEDRTLLLDGETIALTVREAEVLAYLLARPGEVVSRLRLEREVWGFRAGVRSQAVPVSMRRLRTKIGDGLLETVRSAGWRFTPPVHEVERPRFGTPYQSRIEDEAALDGLHEAGWQVITLTGPGGAGKTRLAYAMAQRWDPDALWVQLGEASSEAMVLRQLGTAVGASSATWSNIARSVEARERWIVLDEVEGVIEVLKRGFAQVSSGRFLVTSRAPLGIQREAVHEVGGLRGEAGRRFLQSRLAASRWGGSAEDGLLDKALHAFDGLPLALELVAAHPEPLEALVDHLESGQFLDGPEGDTLGRTLQRSIDRLENKTREVLCALCLCKGTLTAPQVEAWLGPGAAGELRRLAEHSLVVRDHGWRVLRTHRVYMATQEADWASLRQSFDAYLFTVVEPMEDLFLGHPGKATALMEPLVDDLMDLWERAPPDRLQDLTLSLSSYFITNGPSNMAKFVLDEGHARCPDDALLAVWSVGRRTRDGDVFQVYIEHEDPAVQARAFWNQARLGGDIFDRDRLQELIDESTGWTRRFAICAMARAAGRRDPEAPAATWTAWQREFVEHPKMAVELDICRSMQERRLGRLVDAERLLRRAQQTAAGCGAGHRARRCGALLARMHVLREVPAGLAAMRAASALELREGSPDFAAGDLGLTGILVGLLGHREQALEDLEVAMNRGDLPQSEGLRNGVTLAIQHLRDPTKVRAASLATAIGGHHRLVSRWVQAERDGGPDWISSLVSVLEAEAEGEGTLWAMALEVLRHRQRAHAAGPQD